MKKNSQTPGTPFNRLVLRLLTLAALGAGGTSCSYVGQRVSDFTDIVRIEGNLGLGLQAHVTATALLHTGVGSSRQGSAGLTYGHWESRWQVEDHFPLSYVYTLMDPSKECLHSLDIGEGVRKQSHRCYMIVPGELRYGNVEREKIHYFDVEVGFLAGAVGVEAGFSIGELVDFLLGFFKFSDGWTFLDPAGDDKPGARQNRTLWLTTERREVRPPP